MNNKLWVSQNFIKNPDLIAKLIKKNLLNKTDIIIDIGVGKGIISNELLKQNFNVMGFELDRQLYEEISNQINSPNYKILNEDFIKFDLKKLNSDFSVFSNIPYSQTTEIVSKLLIKSAYAREVILVMQQNAAERFLGVNEGLLVSLLILNNYTAGITYKFRKTDFTPAPKVNSVLIKFTKRDTPLINSASQKNFLDFISYIIMQQKPTIIDRLSKVTSYNSLKNFFTLVKVEPYNSLYQIPKIKYFEMFNVFESMFPQKIKLFEGSFEKYQLINSKNNKKYRSRV